MPWHAVEGPVQAEALPHPGHGAAEDFHVAARVVAADALLVDPQAGNQVIQRVAGAAGFAEQHLRHVDRVDAMNLARRQAVAAAGGC